MVTLAKGQTERKVRQKPSVISLLFRAGGVTQVADKPAFRISNRTTILYTNRKSHRNVPECTAVLLCPDRILM
eukprot:scaffold90924_cov30-Prasinocladus_malaysianus.AAC.1